MMKIWVFFINQLHRACQHKGRLAVLVLFSLYTAFLMVFYSSFHYVGVFGGLNENYIDPVALWQLLLLLPCAAAVFCLTLLLGAAFESLAEKRKPLLSGSSREGKKLLILAGIFLLCWLPYLLAFYPGCICADGFSSIQQIVNGSLDNHHPVLYTFFVGIFIRFGQLFHSIELGILLYSVAQSVLMALTLSYFVFWLKKKGLPFVVPAICGAVFAFFPLFPFYAITMWKDTLFSLLLLLFTLVQVDTVLSDGRLLREKTFILRYVLLALGVMFTRNNGVYIVFFTLLCLGLFLLKRKTKCRVFWGIILAVFAATMLIQGPVFKKIGWTTEFVESIGVPMQQISMIVAMDGDITQEEKAFLENIWDLEELGQKYTPCLADTPKWYIESFDPLFLEAHKGEFLKTWASLCWRNPDLALKAFLLENLGFWHLGVSGSEAYVQNGMWELNEFQLVSKDLLSGFLPFSFQSILLPRHYLSCGFLAWLMVLTLVLTILRGGLKNGLLLAPVLGCWLTILIATPLALSLRYMFVLVLMFPLYFALPLLASWQEKERRLR